MKISKLLLSAVMTVAGCSFIANSASAEIPKNELRSAWLPTISTNTSWPGSTTGTTAAIAKKQQESLIKHIDRMVKYNCNALSFQVRPMGDALYKSSCEPWSHYLTGKRGSAPTYDPLEFFVKECHARGIEAHAWVNPFRLKKGNTPLTAYDQAHIDKGWTITYDNPTEGSTTIFDPGNPEVRKYIVDRVVEIVKNYDVDGVMFDDYFYCPGLPYNITSGYDYDEYKASGSKLSLADWRRENVNKMIAETHAAIKAIKPWVRFGLSPRGIGGGPSGVSAKKYGLPACPASAGDGMYNSIFCDPLAWMAEKTIDYISPQIYWPTTQSNAPYQPITNWWGKVSDKLDVAFYSSVGAYRNYSVGEMGTELNINRDENNDGDNGVVFYAAGDMDQYDSELKTAFATKAILPPMRNHVTTSPGKIESLTVSGTTLTCSPLKDVRYVFYAVPTSVSPENAASKVKTGLNAEYILGISYSPTYTLPSDKTSGYWYAVTPYDRCGYEWEMTTAGDTSAKYAPVTDDEVYDLSDPLSSGRELRLQNLWIRSDKHGNALGISDKQCRDFTVIDDIIYVANMDAVSSTSAFRLFRYKTENGEQLPTLELIPDEKYTGFYAPLTTVTTDDAGNLIVAGMALNANSKMVVGTVDTTTGKVTTVVSLPVVARIDHIDVIGDIKQDGYIIGASGTTSDAYRWRITKGALAETKTFAIGATPGTAPRIHAVSETGAFIDGSSTPFHYYDFSLKKATGKFADSKPVQVNGGAFFTLDNLPMIVYPHTNFADGICFSIDYGKSLPKSYDNLATLWKFTPKNFGSSAPVGGDFGALAEVRQGAEEQPTAYIYTYAANNSLAAYKLDFTKPSSVEGIAELDGVALTMNDGVLSLGREVSKITAYNAAGVTVAQGTDTDILNLKGQSGLHIIKIEVNGTQKSVKVIL